MEGSNHDQFQSKIDLGEVSAYWIQAAENGIQKWGSVIPTCCKASPEMDLAQDHV